MFGTTKNLSALNPDHMRRAAELIQAGQLVAFPTETVYGLGANALDPEAVARIFAAKGRPADNPLIVHVLDFAAAQPLWDATPRQLDVASKLAAAFWPGPLSLVLPASPSVPDKVTAGLGSVAVRAPANPSARQLLAACQRPVAAPSANLSGRPSPTRAEHVAITLSGRIAAILDGGATTVGIESTVLDLRSDRPVLLRPGSIDAKALQALVTDLVAAAGAGNEGSVPATTAALAKKEAGDDHDTPSPSPGMRHRHYQPAGVGVELAALQDIVDRCPPDAAIICRRSAAAKFGVGRNLLFVLPDDASGFAAGLYDALYQVEASGVGRLWIERPPPDDEWRAVRDRLHRAAGD
jgi:L-threonylcarbamoyladenylate synthase